uniref:HTH OST-type domain-containing protein n=1 Tax=Angiostrongylus costaricensis TaxID=334426 RepID=A0A158PFI7_ANGCS
LFRYVLRVDCTHKSGTLERGVTRSQSRSSSRGATPEQGSIRFSPRTDGYPVLSRIVQRFCANSKDGTINWNAVRNQYRKETGRHLNTEELNGICGTINMTKHDLLSTHLSTMVEILDSRGQIVKLAASFSPERLSPAFSHSHSSPGGEKQFQSNSPLDIDKDNDRRQHIVEQLKRIGVIVDGNGRAVILEEQQPPSSERPTNPGADSSKVNPAISGDTMMTSESGHTSFYSVNQVLETSGEGGYATACDASPEGDVSLNLSFDRSGWESTPRRMHEITLCNFTTSELHREYETESQKGAKTSTPKQKHDNVDHQDTTPVVGKHYRKLDLDVHECEVENCVKETSDYSNKNEKFTLTEPMSLADYNKSGYCSKPGSNHPYKSDDGHIVNKSEGSFLAGDVIEENSDGPSRKSCDHSESCREEMDSGQERSTDVENATVKELCTLFEGAINRTKGHPKAFDLVLPEERVVLSVEHLKEFEHTQRMEGDVDAKNCLKNDDLIDSAHDMLQSDFERKLCIEMDPIPDDVHVVNRYLRGRHHSLPVFLEYTQVLHTGRRENTPASEPSDEILNISAKSPIESVTITVEEDKTGDTEVIYYVILNIKGKDLDELFKLWISNFRSSDEQSLCGASTQPGFLFTELSERFFWRLTIVNLRHAFYLVSPYETAVPTLDQVPNYNVEVSTWWIVFIAVEFLILAISGHHERFALNDSITSICAGMLSQCFKFGGRTVAIFLYVFIWNNFRLLELPWDCPWTWILCLFFQDLMYYFGHRAVHGIYPLTLHGANVLILEAGFFWGLHTIHHSSEYYNFSTALRQAAIQDAGLAIYDVLQAFFIPPPIFLVHRYFSEILQFVMHTSVSATEKQAGLKFTSIYSISFYHS